LTGLFSTSNAAAAITIEPLRLHTNEFSGREVTRSFHVNSDEPLAGRLVWNLKTQQRTLARGEQEVRVRRQAVEAKIKFRLDALRDEVTLSTTLTVAVVVDEDEVAREEIRLWFFAEDPFANRSKWLRSLDITLFDPSGGTAKRFAAAEIVFKESRNLVRIRNLDRGTLVIGAGVSLADHRGLAPAALAAAAQGTRVLWLNAADGSFPMEPLAKSNRLSFADAEIIQQLDKRLDSMEWAGGRVIGSRLGWRVRGKQISLQIGEQGWPWAEAHWSETGGRFIYSGFPIIDRWDTSPAPRYTVLRILERLNAEEMSE
jgi:hypothetical protein